jgi:dTDP-4-amino-4,6-dideoxygalactose transaminase
MPRSTFLPFAPPCLGEAEIAAVSDVLRAGQWLSSGPKTKEFEEKFRERVGAPAAVALNSATAGLHLSMVLHGVGPGDEVITSPMTFAATANVVEHVGGTVVLADIEPDTLLMDPSELEKVITRKTKVVTPVHYAGHACDMERINRLAESASFAVVEDAAHCGPSLVHGKPVGSSLRNLSLFSFYANKNMTTGEGGMMVGPVELIDRARVLALHGMSRNAWNRFAKGGSWRYDVPEPGYKYNLTDIASALGVVQLSRLDELYALRMRMVDVYDREFAGHPHVTPLKRRAGYQSSHHIYVIQLNLETLSIGRDEFIVQLTERNIGTSVHYTPLHMMSFYAKKYGWKPESFPKAARAFERIVSLPLSSALTARDAEDVVEAVNDICRKYKR